MEGRSSGGCRGPLSDRSGARGRCALGSCGSDLQRAAELSQRRGRVGGGQQIEQHVHRWPGRPAEEHRARGSLAEGLEVDRFGSEAVVYRLRGMIAVVSVLPSLTTRTGPASRSSLLGRTNVSFSGRTCFCSLPAMVIATTNCPWSE